MRLVAQLLICAGIAAVPALMIGNIALDHNPQGEFASMETGRYTSDLYRLVGVWWAMFAVPLMALAALIHALRRRDH